LVNNSSGRNSLKVISLASLAYPELGTAQPKLVYTLMENPFHLNVYFNPLNQIINQNNNKETL
jgi:hypothetical protein